MFLELLSSGTLKKSKAIGKQNNLQVFGSNKTKGPKQDSQNWLR